MYCIASPRHIIYPYLNNRLVYIISVPFVCLLHFYAKLQEFMRRKNNKQTKNKLIYASRPILDGPSIV